MTAPKPAFLSLDTRDDRREIHRLLQLLHPRDCLRWLARQCRKARPVAHGTRPAPSRKMLERVRMAEIYGAERHYRLATEVYGDFWSLCMQYGLDADAATRELEALARRER